MSLGCTIVASSARLGVTKITYYTYDIQPIFTIFPIGRGGGSKGLRKRKKNNYNKSEIPVVIDSCTCKHTDIRMYTLFLFFI